MIIGLGELPVDARADVCVVGAGAAGLTLALELERRGRRVLVLEAGGDAATPDAPGDTAVSTGFGRDAFHAGRASGLGGTTALWSAQVIPLSALDFAPRPWVPGSGWPVTEAEVAGWIPGAEATLGLPSVGYDAASWPATEPAPHGALGDGLELRWSQTAARPDLGAAHRAALAASREVTVVTGAPVTGLDVASGRVTGVRVGGPAEHARLVVADRVVLCLGTVATLRLLLHALGDVAPEPVLRALGRGFGDHAFVRPELAPAGPAAVRRLRSRVSPGRGRIRPKLAASAAWQRDHAALAVAADANWEGATGSSGAAGRRAVTAVRGRDVAGALHELPALAGAPMDVARIAWGAVRWGLRPGEVVSQGHLVVQCETAPGTAGSVALRPDRDPLGVPRAEVRWWVGEAERRTLAAFTALVARRLAAARLGRLAIAFPPLDDDAGWQAVVGPGHHHSGGAPMGRHGVVDTDLQVHGVAGLHVASAAVFPTSGWANPTLTLLALVLRLAARLAEEG